MGHQSSSKKEIKIEDHERMNQQTPRSMKKNIREIIVTPQQSDCIKESPAPKNALLLPEIVPNQLMPIDNHLKVLKPIQCPIDYNQLSPKSSPSVPQIDSSFQS